MKKELLKKIITGFYFSNIFLIFLSLSLNFETVVKLGLPRNSTAYYLYITSLSVLFYLYAYKIPKKAKFSNNIRIQFYIENKKLISLLIYVLVMCCMYSGAILYNRAIDHIKIVSWSWIVVLIFSVIFIFSYYDSRLGVSLRKFMWIKPILIGWAWAITTVFLPVLFFVLENNILYTLDIEFYFLFFQTFIYCFINAILFDLKDSTDDRNKNIKTFIVKYGYYYALNRIILPIIFLAFFIFLTVEIWIGAYLDSIILMLIPVVCLGIFALKLNKPRSILYYLIVIDGIVFLKAICGILSGILLR